MTSSCGCLKRELAGSYSITHGESRRGKLSHRLELWRSAKMRAKKFEVPFSLTLDDIVIPVTCEVLGIPLIRGVGVLHHNSPSVDRIRPERGYVPDNIRVISHRANTLKRDATIPELEKIIEYMKREESDARLE